MADVYKCLGQAAPASLTDTDVYTVPASTAAIVSAITIANRGATDDYVYVYHRLAGAATATKQALCIARRVPANGQISLVCGLCMAATDVITVDAGTANLSVSVYGVEQNPVPTMVPKNLGQLKPSGGGGANDLYTVPGGKSAIIAALSIANASTNLAAVRFWHRVGGGSTANQDYLLYDMPMSANPQTAPAPEDSNLLLVLGITAAAADVIRVSSSVADVCFNIWGVEL